MIKQLLACFALAAMLISCNSKDEKKETKDDILFSSLDTTVRPSDDFFEYANGGWIKKNPIPNEQSSWGIGNLVFEENLRRTREISEEAAKSGAAKGSNEQKIGDFWSSGMDSVKIENDGLKHLQPYLDKINAITDIKSLLATVSEFRKLGSYTLFADFVTQDDKNSEVMTYKLWQGGIGLPEREYYFKTDSATKTKPPQIFWQWKQNWRKPAANLQTFVILMPIIIKRQLLTWVKCLRQLIGIIFLQQKA